MGKYHGSRRKKLKELRNHFKTSKNFSLGLVIRTLLGFLIGFLVIGGLIKILNYFSL